MLALIAWLEFIYQIAGYNVAADCRVRNISITLMVIAKLELTCQIEGYNCSGGCKGSTYLMLLCDQM